MSNDPGTAAIAPRRLRVGVIGDPVAHSLSPAFQQPAFDSLGIPATFDRWHTSAAALAARVAGLRAADALGACVTVPHKLAVIPLLDEIAPSARRAGAVNTIVNRDGRLVGENTDVYGFAASLRAVCWDVASRPALVLGAGGAARAVVVALHDLSVLRLLVANRRWERAKTLAADLPDLPIVIVPPGEAALEAALRETRLLVNATSLGWRPDESPLTPAQLALLPADALVVDLTYRDTDLILAARARGLATLDGLGMLVHQGARAFELWTGRPAPLSLMMEAAQAARAGH